VLYCCLWFNLEFWWSNWATKHLAQARVPRLSEKSCEFVLFLLDSPHKRETLVLGEERSRPSEKNSLKREFAL